MAKKFAFSLQKLLDFKEQIFEIERTILTEMNAALLTMQNELADLYAEHRRKSDDLIRKSAVGMSAFEIMSHKNYLTVLEERIEEKLRQLELQKEAIDKQMDKVREAKMEISTMEKLKEKKLEEYNYRDQKSQELFIDEFVNNTRAVSSYAQ